MSDQSTHTPGPWEIDEGDGMAIAKVSFHAITAPCTADIGSLSREEVNANLRLIAAAPDLLAALNAILAEPYGCTLCDSGVPRSAKGHQPDCPYKLALAAVARAEGRYVESR